jgi:serine/threonine-protein kinase HipA
MVQGPNGTYPCSDYSGTNVYVSKPISFNYDTKYLNSNQSQKLSSALPLQSKIYKHQECHAFFSGLLPDEELRITLARYLKISETNVFGLLTAIGGECAGAISLQSPKKNQRENSNVYKVLSDKEAQKLLLSLEERPFLVGERGIRMSAGGAQNKLMVSFIENKLALPLYDSPSTHILKPAIKAFPHSIFNEFFCMKLAYRLGLNTANAEIIWIGNQAYYVTERFDRVSTGSGKITRLHQEDFCQALNISPELKYENEGGPSLLQCKQLIDEKVKKGLMKGASKIEFLKIIVFNYLIGNGDAHGKNFSLLYI